MVNWGEVGRGCCPKVPFKWGMHWSEQFILLFQIVVGVSLAVLFNEVFANESDPIELVQKHDEQWERIKSIQLSYTRNYVSDGVSISLDCYWESQGERSRAIVATLDGNNVAMRRDSFNDGKNLYRLTIPQDKYPLDDMKLCDYASFLGNIEGCDATFIPAGVRSIGTDIRLNFPLPKYLFVPTEGNLMTLSELINKYPSRVVSVKKNSSGDGVAEIIIESESHVSNRRLPGTWILQVYINTGKGYKIDGYRLSAVIQTAPLIEAIMERTVKKYSEIEAGYWIPSEWESIEHSGNPASDSAMNYIISNVRINENPTPRIHDFRFPINFPVLELTPADQPEKIHIWGADNKPSRTFANHVEYIEYYADECPPGELLPQENKYLALRISLVVLGLIMIIVALYRLYAKKH
jgi:hypothetical protein